MASEGATLPTEPGESGPAIVFALSSSLPPQAASIWSMCATSPSMRGRRV